MSGRLIEIFEDEVLVEKIKKRFLFVSTRRIGKFKSREDD
jgi:hypothetical protein